MKLNIEPGLIPGTAMDKVGMGNVTGMDFLDKIFYISHGIMLTQIRDISGVDGSTLQNWVKRGWIENTVNKKYSKDQLARILIINMLRDCMLLENIDILLHYINGEIGDTSDDIIPESELFDYICRIYERFVESGYEKEEELQKVIHEVIANYQEPISGAKERLSSALQIIMIAYFSSIVGKQANKLFYQVCPVVKVRKKYTRKKQTDESFPSQTK